MPAKPEKTIKQGHRGRHGVAKLPSEAKVSATINMSRETFDMLSDAALAREIVKVAEASHGVKIPKQGRYQSVAALIEELIDLHRGELEAEGETVRNTRTRRKQAKNKRPKEI